MAITPVPVLGTQGFATDSVTKFSTLMAHLFLSDSNQTQLYIGQVTSIAAILADSGSDQIAIVNNLRNGLSQYFARYYTSSSVDVQILNPDDLSTALTLKLIIKVYDEGQELTQAWQFDSTNNILSNVINLNNYGIVS